MTDGENRDIQTFTAYWSGIALRIAFEPNWLGGNITAHLDIHSVAPDRAPLPITETGYRSHFCAANEIDDAGGPVAFVLAWLDAASLSPSWKAAEQARRQLSLF